MSKTGETVARRAGAPADRQAVRVAALLAALSAGAPVHLSAFQCPDGTPPPCGPARARAVARPAPPPAAERARRFVVLPFRNITRAAEHDWLVEGSTTMLNEALGRWEEIRIVPDERLYPALRRAGIEPGSVPDAARVRRLAEETGGWTAVSGEVLATGGRLRVSARAYDVVTNREVARARSEVPASADVRLAYDTIGAQLLRSAGLDASTLDLAAATTHSLEAYRAYLRGVVHENRGEYRRAGEAYTEAVRLDTAFAQAYARLANVSITSLEALLDPRSPGYAHAERAAALSERLPARDRELVRAIHAFFNGQFSAARQRFESLVAADSNDAEAMEWLSNLEMSDGILVGGARRGSLNHAVRLAKRVLDLDPSRHRMYGLLVQGYSMAAGWLGGMVPGFGREAASLPALFTSQPAALFMVLHRDTLELRPLQQAAELPEDTLEALRTTALGVARAWADRWLLAGPTQSAAHFAAARVYEMEGRFTEALTALARAESLGVETDFENLALRRLVLLGKSRRFVEALRVADSLSQAGYFDSDLIVAGMRQEGVVWAFNLRLLTGGFDAADALIERMSRAARSFGYPAPLADIGSVIPLCLAIPSPVQKGLPDAFRTEVAESALARVASLPASRLLDSCVPLVVQAAAREDSAARTRIAAAASGGALALGERGRAGLAFELAIVAAAAQRPLPRQVVEAAWYSALAEPFAASRRRFRATSASVTSEEAVFEWRVEGAEPFRWNRAETAVLGDEHGWQADVVLRDTTHRIRALQFKLPGAQPQQGDLAGLTRAVTLRQVRRGAPPGRAVAGAAVRVEATPGVLRLVLADSALVAALRAERPRSASLRLLPCVPMADDPEPACRPATVPISYP